MNAELSKDLRDANWRRRFWKKYGKLFRTQRTFRWRRLGQIYKSAARAGRNMRFMRKMREV